jgi:hypothetical protein
MHLLALYCSTHTNCSMRTSKLRACQLGLACKAIPTMTARGPAEAQRDTVARAYVFRDFLGAISNSHEQI